MEPQVLLKHPIVTFASVIHQHICSVSPHPLISVLPVPGKHCGLFFLLYSCLSSYSFIPWDPSSMAGSAGDERQPFSSASRRHANSEVIWPVFVGEAASTAAPAPPGQSQFVCLFVCPQNIISCMG